MYLNQKNAKKLVEVSQLVGGINALNSVEGYVPSRILEKRKASLRKQLKELVNGEEEKGEAVVKLRIEIPEGEPKKEPKTLNLKLKDLFSGKLKADDEEGDEVIQVIRGCFPEETLKVAGKVITEL
jgi:hypothetical protein